MEFTKEELFEIEKVFDNQASMVVERHVRVNNSIITIVSNKKVKEYQKNIFDETMTCFDMYRTISAKCQKLRNGNKN